MSYDYYDSRVSIHTRRCIDGSVTGANCCVGYCSYAAHEGFLTKDLRKQHNCIKNGCWYYIAKESRTKEAIPIEWMKAAQVWGIA